MADNEDVNEQDSIEVTGKSTEEAIEDGLEELQLGRHEVSIEVLSEGRTGLFGIGGEPARVRLTPVTFEHPEGEDVDFAYDTLETLLRLMEIDAEITVRAPETPGDGLGLTRAVLDVTGDDLGVLIGRRGSTLASLQYLVNLTASRKFKQMSPFSVDVEGYRRRREETLQELAFQAAEEVRETGRTVTLQPMPPNERRIIHITLAKDPTVGTTSVGEGDVRKVSIRTIR